MCTEEFRRFVTETHKRKEFSLFLLIIVYPVKNIHFTGLFSELVGSRILDKVVIQNLCFQIKFVFFFNRGFDHLTTCYSSRLLM